MHVEIGIENFGKVDEVPGILHVATRFFHLSRLPLFPLGSFIHPAPKGDWFEPVRIRLSLKSVAFGWARGLLGACGLVCIILLIHHPRRQGPQFATLTATATLAALGFWASYRIKGFGRATYERAVALAEHAGLPEETLVRLELAFGRVSPEQAEAALAELREHAEEAARLTRDEEDDDPDA